MPTKKRLQIKDLTLDEKDLRALKDIQPDAKRALLTYFQLWSWCATDEKHRLWLSDIGEELWKLLNPKRPATQYMPPPAVIGVKVSSPDPIDNQGSNNA